MVEDIGSRANRAASVHGSFPRRASTEKIVSGEPFSVFTLIILVAGYFGILVVGVAGWKIACWFFRALLDIPKYPPVHEAEVQQLPFYLEDRIAPPKL
jgi:hypothetical protein